MNERQKHTLIEQARIAAQNAYAPYSNYKVGAALLCGSGEIYRGCNVENASYGLTICAERSAVFAARCAGEHRFTALAVFAPQAPAPMPCGACRQVLAEGGNNPDIIVAGANGDVMEKKLSDLLPFTFELLDN